MKPLLLFSVLMVHIVGVFAQPTTTVQIFPLQDVRLLEGPFKQAEDLNKRYLLELDADRLLAPFLREAGLPPKKASYGNWENTGLDGHIGGHYLTALSLMYASTSDMQIKERLAYMVAELKRCQNAHGDGYIGGVPGGNELWTDIREGKIAAGGFDLGKKWVPLYNIHKTYAGLRDAYRIAGHPDAKEMLVKMTDWAIQLVQGLSDEQIQEMLRSEHGGLNEVFADVAVITGDYRYLALAKQFSHQSILKPLLNQEDQLTGLHANTQIPKVIGFKRIADIEGNTSWSEAARFFWETVVQNRSVSIGGNSAYEHFHPTDDFSRMIRGVEGPETCNTYNMLKLAKQLFQTEPAVRYMDFYERALYNHVLSTQHPKQGGFVYFTPMRPGHYRVYSQPHTSFWCCVGSGLENHSKYGDMIYAHRGDELYVNLLVPSRLDWKAKNVWVEQQNHFPEESSTSITISTKESTVFTLKLRYPNWVREGEMSIFINDQEIPMEQRPGSYISITRQWENDDVVRMEFTMHTSVEQLPDSSNYYAFLYGPIVLAAKTDTAEMTGLFADESRGGHIAHGKQVPLREIPIVMGQREELADLPRRNPKSPGLQFSLSDFYPATAGNEMELIPFYQLHESRYILYWPYATPHEAAMLQEKIELEEQESIRLDALTVDRVSCGQQQPESDHAIQFDSAVTGVYEGVQWREARGWFSYQLTNPNRQANYLYIRYCDIDRPSDFDIQVGGHTIGSIRLSGKSDGDGFATTIYSLPDDVMTSENLIVKFEAHDRSVTAKLVEVRLLSAKLDE